ncbi:MAG: hypothetical protein AB8B81_07630 [Halioglobus sp.]
MLSRFSLDVSRTSHPSRRVALVLIGLVVAAMVVSVTWLLSVQDATELKQLIEDSGPVQMVGQTCIGLAFVIAIFYATLDASRRKSFLMLSYILLFYTLREADYHYKVSDHAKVSQIKRFYLHDMIPLSTKLLTATIVILLLVVMYRYVMREKDHFIVALRQLLPWSMATFVWGGVLGISQVIDQVPIFHNLTGQVFEEVFESSAEALALMALIFYLVHVYSIRAMSEHRQPPEGGQSAF